MTVTFCPVCDLPLRRGQKVKQDRTGVYYHDRCFFAEAYPGGRNDHTEGADCWCKPYRDSEVTTVLVHRKVVGA